VQSYLSGGGIRQTIVVPRRLVNIVTQEPASRETR
jgi:hypothetical protein